MRALCKRGLQTHHGGRSLDGASEVGADHFASVALFLFPLASSEKGRVSPQVPFVAGAFYLMCCVLVLCGCFETSDAFVILGTTLSAPLFCVCNNNSKRDYAMVNRGGGSWREHRRGGTLPLIVCTKTAQNEASCGAIEQMRSPSFPAFVGVPLELILAKLCCSGEPLEVLYIECWSVFAAAFVYTSCMRLLSVLCA